MGAWLLKSFGYTCNTKVTKDNFDITSSKTRESEVFKNFCENLTTFTTDHWDPDNYVP